MRILPLFCLIPLLSFGACHSYTGNGALGGAAFGAGSGALFASAVGKSTGGGALIGAGLGALAGAAFGSGLDHAAAEYDERVVYQEESYEPAYHGHPYPVAPVVIRRTRYVPAPFVPAPVIIHRGYWGPAYPVHCRGW